MNAQDLKDCFKILDIAAQTIQKVQFAFFSEVPKPSRPLDLARLHSLRNLEFKMQPLRLGTRVFGAGLDAGFEQLYDLLDSPSPSCNLRFISFSITASEGYPRDELFLVADDSKWLALDTLLSGPKFSSVQTVSVSLSLAFRSGASDKPALIAKAHDLLKKAFPTVLASKSLKIEVNIVR
ncbi:hypothetical protein GALMADRAFT_210163 [Galerina marginata CBS 339.88]|uniref:Uncharacterized protein n=1 Tax=Galerina marginata (strain CBS 339.88) TaxID=685588 RepID=A0A067TDF6_GALM3|nr:hypothetical protein GALMADRAFT_210163 [Galerina marginata CBS 339.88]